MSVSSANRYRFADEKAAEVRRQDAHLVYKNGGGAHLDLFTARHLVKCFNAERA